MPRIAVSQHINAPADRVFAICTDLENAAEVIPEITSLTVVTEGPFGVGTTWDESRVMMGKECSERMEVIEFEPGRSYTTLAGSHGCEYRTAVVVEPNDSGCTLTYDMQAKATSFKAKLMAPLFFFMKGMVRKAFAKDLNRVKDAAEGNPPPATAAATP